MELLPTAPDEEKGSFIEQDLALRGVLRPFGPIGDPTEPDVASSVQIIPLLRSYWLFLLILIVLGAAGGFTSVVLSSPMYKARLLIEVQNIATAVLKNSLEGESFEANEVNIQTQINILRSGPFLKRGADRLQSDTVPLAPSGQDLFSRLRQRIRPATQDPLESARRGLNVASATFSASPVNKTRLIELTCQSTSPDVAAQFLNSMAAEFVEDASQSRMQASQKTSEWLSAQIEETKSKLDESEAHLRDFVQASGNLFAGQDVTLDDTKLAQLKSELAKIQAERIARQTRYELTLNNPPDALGEVLDDNVLLGYAQQINTLKRDKAALETTLTSKNDKVRRIDAELAPLETAYKNELTSVVARIRNDYEAATRQEKLLSSAYDAQSQRVGAQAGKAAQYGSLKREVETLRQLYQNLLTRSNEAGLTSSLPISPLRIVEPAVLPEAPYSPVPSLNISIGALLGGVLAGAIVFLRSRMDRSIKSPGSSRQLLNVQELGVIPALPSKRNQFSLTKRKLQRSSNSSGESLSFESDLKSFDPTDIGWQDGPTFIAESFRGTLASILRNEAVGKPQRTLLITSPGPAEGKTTVVQNLGIALAESGRRILLVDADFRRPHLHHKFRLQNDRALIDLVLDQRPLSDLRPGDYCLESKIRGLFVLPNRSIEINVSQALYSPSLRAALRILATEFDMILVDTPPILPFADARILGPFADAVILVLRCGKTREDTALEAFQKLQEDNLRLLGTVLTDWDWSSNAKRQHYYQYNYPSNSRS